MYSIKQKKQHFRDSYLFNILCVPQQTNKTKKTYGRVPATIVRTTFDFSTGALGRSTMDDAVQDLRQTVTVVVGGILGHILV